MAVKLGVVVLAHRLPDQVAELGAVLRHPQIRLYLHVDRRVAISDFTAALAAAGVDNVNVLPRHALRWGSPAIVDATLGGLAAAVRDGCDYVVLVSGQDFPVRPAPEILSFFEEADGRSYMAHWPLPTPRWRFGGRDRTDFYSYTILGRRETCIPRGEDTSSLSLTGRMLNTFLRLRTLTKPPRRFPRYVSPYGGWQWWNLSRVAARYVLDFIDAHPDYRGYHDYTSCPDEIFFQSILLGTPFAAEHEVVDDSLRFFSWRPGESHPDTLRLADLPEILGSGQLFARKFDSQVDGAVLRRLAERVAA
jgi:hypothetical protein